MATPRRKARATTDEGRFIASRIQDARRRGYSTKIIADSYGINERTVRKILSGETSGRRLYAQHIAPTRDIPFRAGTSPNIVRLDVVIGQDARGKDVVRTVNAKVDLVNGRTPTPFDVLRMPNLALVAQAEADRMRRQYVGMAVIEADADDLDEMANETPRIQSIRPIQHRRDPKKRYVTIRGEA